MEEKMEERKCEICKEKASCMCFDCSFYLCDNCFQFIHEKEANSEHRKEVIEPFISSNIRCPVHPKIPMNLFCKEEKGKLYIFNIYLNI